MYRRIRNPAIVILILSICLFLGNVSYAAVTNVTTSETATINAGDINGDGAVNNKDLTRLFQYLSGWDVTVENSCCDVNGDGAVNNKDLTRLFQYLSGWNVEITGGQSSSEDPDQKDPTDPSEENPQNLNVSHFTYGTSVNGRNLICYSISPEEYDKTILLEFEIHGFEDEYAHDGQVLVDTANQLIEHYSRVEDLNRTRLLIIPSSNPDGLLDGTTNNGFGRCNADGIDLNRDFDANYSPNSSSRNYTPAAFSGVESRALKDLVLTYKPDIVIDFHGWESSLIGDPELKQPFNQELGLRISNDFTSTNAPGYFSNWAHQQGALAMLVEFTNSTSIDMDKLINAIDRLINNQYDTGHFSGDLSFLENKSIVIMAPTKITISSSSYVDANDICIMTNINIDDGTCTLTYPSGGSNVFTSGITKKEATIKLSQLFNVNEAFELVEKTSDSKIQIYPTTALSQLGTNWYLDAGDEYYILNETDTTTMVMYYCATGGHAGYWKIGYAQK